jgi:hypothetical protein
MIFLPFLVEAAGAAAMEDEGKLLLRRKRNALTDIKVSFSHFA